MKLFLYGADGRITQALSGALSPADLDDLRERGLAFVLVPDRASAANSYVVDGELMPRPVADIRITKTELPANKRARATITGLPDPCTLFIDGEPVTVEGGRLELTADMPATYSIAFNQFPFMPWSAEITAT
jgi:hypothetical protein